MITLRRTEAFCSIICVMPPVYSTIVYRSLVAMPNTHGSGSHGILVSKQVFYLSIIALAIVWYYLSRYIQENYFPGKIRLRVVLSILFSAMSIWLISENLV